MFVANMLNIKPNEAMNAPTIAVARQPKMFANALTIGPETKAKLARNHEMNVIFIFYECKTC